MTFLVLFAVSTSGLPSLADTRTPTGYYLCASPRLAFPSLHQVQRAISALYNDTRLPSLFPSDRPYRD
jgi:hypothetical protein